MSNAPLSPILIDGCRPLAITKAEFFKILRSPRIGQRALYWTRRGKPFVTIVRQGGRGCTVLIDTHSVEVFYAGLLSGELQPPLMPGERKFTTVEPQNRNDFFLPSSTIRSRKRRK